MGWLFGKKAEERIESQVKFVGEQDGKPERELKSLFSDLFKEYPNVQKAYLAQVKFDGSNSYDVVLCLKSTQDEQIV